MSIIAFIIGFLFGLWLVRVVTDYQVIEDAEGSAYMVRYFLWRPDWAAKLGINPKKLGRIYLHHFLRSDHDRSLHDHPWRFRSLILWPGYTEIADIRQIPISDRWQWKTLGFGSPDHYPQVLRDFGPLSFIKRGAGWRHRVVLNKGRCWTIVFCGPKVRSWGFWTDLLNNKWCHWRSYDTRTGLCEETEPLGEAETNVETNVAAIWWEVSER